MKKQNILIAAFKDKEVRNAILFTFGILIVYHIGCMIPTPGTIVQSLSEAVSGNSFLAMLNMLNGGALANFSIFALGVSPFITASIIIQLLSMDVVPCLTEMTKSGEKGRVKLNRVTRWVGLAMAIVQAFGITYGFDKQYGIMMYSNYKYYLYVITLLVGGYSVSVWLADKISKHGIANGMSMIIFAGIVSSIPAIFKNTFTSLIVGETGNEMYTGVAWFALFCLLYIVIILAVIWMETSFRRIHVYYSGQAASSATKDANYIPIKVNPASVLPVIFAQSVTNVVLMVLSFANHNVYEKVSDVLSLNSVLGLIIYALMVILFTFLYSNLELNPEQMADNLSKSGGYIMDIRPGRDTEKYLSKTISRVAVAGAIGLTVLAVLPYILSMCTDLPNATAIGGTGMIIVVGVAIEAVNAITSRTVSMKKPSFF